MQLIIARLLSNIGLLLALLSSKKKIID